MIVDRNCLILLAALIPACLAAAPVALTNPSGEINSGSDRTSIPHPAFPGWTGSAAQSIHGNTHGGNGGWRMSISAGGQIRQLSGHVLQVGEALSLRFDASTFSGLPTEVVAELFTETTPGTIEVILAETFQFHTPLSSGYWEGFQLVSGFGELDAHAGKQVGVRFRSTATTGKFMSVDNVRLAAFASQPTSTDFATSWAATPDRPWVGADYWANRLQDWEVSGGRLQTRLGASGRPLRTVHRLTTSVRDCPGELSLSVRTGLASANWVGGASSGIFLGAGASHDFRGAALVHQRGGRDGGIFLGVDSAGAAVIYDNRSEAFPELARGASPASVPASFRIAVTARWQAASRNYLLAVDVRHGGTDAVLSHADLAVEPYTVLGNFGLFSHPGAGNSRFWFEDFAGSGSKLEARPERTFGPVVATQYTLSRGVLKLTAQLAPVAVGGAPRVALEIDTGAGWQTAATAAIDADAYTASFRVSGWDYPDAVPFRVGFGEGSTAFRSGTIQADPVAKPEIVVAALTCMIHCAADAANDGFNGIDEATAGPVSWTRDRINFPHEDIVRNLPLQRPDLYAFTGDQIYEGGSPTTADNSSDENRRLDYLYKWYLFCWTWRDLLAQRPSITIPDDHDVYQGNLWGEGGKPTDDQENGGYTKPASFVRMVERTQTAHLPDPYDPTPVQQGIGVYYGSWVYGRIGFAILEDRKFKNGFQDEGFGAISSGDPNSDTTRFNRPGLELLGGRQEQFLEAFAADWDGQDMKAVISQSPFASSSTHSSASYNRRYFDLDANGWPQDKRDRAVALMRKSFAPHINGDQHVSVLLQHGVAADRDAVYSFCVPSIANAFSRTWDPGNPASGTTNTVRPYTGAYLDGFGNHIHVLAAANPAHYYNQRAFQGTELLHGRAPGYGIVRFNKAARTTTFECWPLFADPAGVAADSSQYAGWPLTIRQAQNDGRTPTGFLPVIDSGASADPVVRVYDEVSGELVYGFRVLGNRFRPPVFANGSNYRTEISYADGSASEVTTGLAANPPAAHSIELFEAGSRYLVRGQALRLRWDCPSSLAVTIDQGVGDVSAQSLHGIGFTEVMPTSDTTWTLRSDAAAGETLQAQASVRVFPTRAEWRAAAFSPADLADPSKETTVWGDDADPDGDLLTNAAEYASQSPPLASNRAEVLRSDIAGIIVSSSSGTYPVHRLRELLPGAGYSYEAQWSGDLKSWHSVPLESLVVIDRQPGGPGETDLVTLRMPESVAESAPSKPERYYRVILRPVAR